MIPSSVIVVRSQSGRRQRMIRGAKFRSHSHRVQWMFHSEQKREQKKASFKSDFIDLIGCNSSLHHFQQLSPLCQFLHGFKQRAVTQSVFTYGTHH